MPRVRTIRFSDIENTPLFFALLHLPFGSDRLKRLLAGGGEDVDYCLRVSDASNGGKLLAVPEACVVHPFWDGSVLDLSRHFFNWAVGDGALFSRHPKYRYWSFPNLPEMTFLLLPLLVWARPWKVLKLIPMLFVADVLRDLPEYKERCRTLLGQGDNPAQATQHSSLKRSHLFFMASHILANAYVNVLECGRLWGHFKRLEPLHGLICHRFDWHCGRLEKAPENFRKREGWKFHFFLGITLYSTNTAE